MCVCEDCVPDRQAGVVATLAEELAEVNFRMRLLDQEKSRLLQRWQRFTLPDPATVPGLSSRTRW